MKKSYLVLLLMSMLTWSCSQESDLLDDSSVQENMPSVRYGGDGKYDLLGHGCDVTNSFFIGKARVINNDKIEAEMPFIINPDKSQLRQEKIISGTTAENYLKTVTKSKSASLGLFALAKGSITNVFTSTSTYTTNYSFATVEKYIQKASYTYVFDAEFMRDNGYLSPEFQYAIMKFTPEQIIKTFGTHVYANVKLGGKLSLMYKADIATSSTDKTKSVEAGASAAFKKIFNADVKYSNVEREKAMFETRESSILVSAVGGDVSIPLTNQIISDWQVQTTLKTDEWERSVTRGENLSLIDIEANTLIPIWEFLNYSAKREALKSAVEKYIYDNKLVDNKVPARPVYPNTLYGGQYLNKGGVLESPNQRYRLTFQHDGNVTIACSLGNPQGKHFWAMNRGVWDDNNVFYMQYDGNLVMRNTKGRCNWDSNTEKIARNGRAHLNNNGDFIIYDAGGNIKWMNGNKW